MATVAQIIAYADRKYKNVVSTADKVTDLNNVLQDIYLKLDKVRMEIATYEDVTTINSVTGTTQVFYALPQYARINDIVKIQVQKEAGSEEYDTFEYAGLNEDITEGQYFGYTEDGTFWLLDDEEPLSAAGLTILIFYYKRPVPMSANNLTAVPNLDPDFHNLLKYGLIVELANQGHHPDADIADYWQKKYDEFMAEVITTLSERNNNTPLQVYECLERM